MQYGASMRYNEKSGLRWYTTLDTEKLAQLKADGAAVELGTLIAPTNLLGGEALSFDIGDENRADCKYEADTWFTEDGFVGFVGSLVEIKDTNAKRDFIGRGYAKITINGITNIFYADYNGGDAANNTRQIGWIANEITNDVDEYSSLTPAQKAVVDKYTELYNTPDL